MMADTFKCELILGDSQQKLQCIEDESVDLTVTSPPYDSLRQYHGFTFDFEQIANHLYRVTKQGGVVVWIVGDETVDGNESCTSFKQALYFRSIGFNLLDTMIYEKTGVGACGSNDCYIQNFEYMFVLTKGKIKTHNLIYDRVNQDVGVKVCNCNRDTHTVDNGKKFRKVETKQLGRRFNIWQYDQQFSHDVYSRKHPAPFPEQLQLDHIVSWSNEGDTVLDPFMGSGTVGKMCKVSNRNFIGIEISEEYMSLQKSRIDSTTEVGTLLPTQIDEDGSCIKKQELII